jgi:hypothetical protein
MLLLHQQHWCNNSFNRMDLATGIVQLQRLGR